jgi:hypothetical protein
MRRLSATTIGNGCGYSVGMVVLLGVAWIGLAAWACRLWRRDTNKLELEDTWW